MGKATIDMMGVYALLICLQAGCYPQAPLHVRPRLNGSSERLAGQPEPRFAHLTSDQLKSLTPAEKADLAQEAVRLTYYDSPENCRKALRHNPNDLDAHFGLGMYDMAKHRNDSGAVQEFRIVVRTQPDNRFASLLLARALARTGHQAEATEIDRKLAAGTDTFGDAARRDLGRRHINL